MSVRGVLVARGWPEEGTWTQKDVWLVALCAIIGASVVTSAATHHLPLLHTRRPSHQPCSRRAPTPPPWARRWRRPRATLKWWVTRSPAVGVRCNPALGECAWAGCAWGGGGDQWPTNHLTVRPLLPPSRSKAPRRELSQTRRASRRRSPLGTRLALPRASRTPTEVRGRPPTFMGFEVLPSVRGSPPPEMHMHGLRFYLLLPLSPWHPPFSQAATALSYNTHTHTCVCTPHAPHAPQAR